MKFYDKAETVALEIIKRFREGNIAQPLANVFIRKGSGAHCENWSWSNQFIVALMGYRDAMGFRQWQAKGRTVKKGEKAFYILAPLRRTYDHTKADGTTEKKQYTYGFKGMPVFGDSQTEGEPLTYDDNEFIKTLPLFELAQSWGMTIKTYKGQGKPALGFFSPLNNEIQLGVENLSTWAHELIHKAEWNLNNCNDAEYAKNKAHAEIVAELGGCVLLTALGHETEADAGGAWQYIQNYAKREDQDVADVCCKLVNRICEAVDYILTESEKLHEVDTAENQEPIAV